MLNAENRTLAVWIEFDELPKAALHRNLLTRITATIGQPAPLLAVPLTAIVREQSRSYVFVQKKDGLLERRLIEVGRSDDRYVEVRSGLTLGETIVVHGTAELQTTYASVR
jgi:multidrug efflux pump subunit AcrA (membrane-fusion protein)